MIRFAVTESQVVMFHKPWEVSCLLSAAPSALLPAPCTIHTSACCVIIYTDVFVLWFAINLTKTQLNHLRWKRKRHSFCLLSHCAVSICLWSVCNVSFIMIKWFLKLDNTITRTLTKYWNKVCIMKHTVVQT